MYECGVFAVRVLRRVVVPCGVVCCSVLQYVCVCVCVCLCAPVCACVWAHTQAYVVRMCGEYTPRVRCAVTPVPEMQRVAACCNVCACVCVFVCVRVCACV